MGLGFLGASEYSGMGSFYSYHLRAVRTGWVGVTEFITHEESSVINVENARRLITLLEDEDNPVDFHMSYWFTHNGVGYNDPLDICRIVKEHPCGTASCLAGYAALEAWQSGDIDKSNFGSVQGVAQQWLGLEYSRSRDLFHGRWNNEQDPGNLEDLTKKEAITELNRLIDLHKMGAE